MSQQGMVVYVDPKNWRAFSARLKAVDPKMNTALRRRLRNAGEAGRSGVKRTLELPSPDGGPDEGKSREALAAATTVQLSFRGKGGTVRIVTSSKGLAPEHVGLVKVYNMEAFRHPVFARGSVERVWVQQKGRPYLGAAFAEKYREDATREISAAFAEAASFLANKGK